MVKGKSPIDGTLCNGGTSELNTSLFIIRLIRLKHARCKDVSSLHRGNMQEIS